MTCQCVRGAITVSENSEESILSSTKELLQEVLTQNEIVQTEISAIIFTATNDLDRAYPARAAREMGLTNIPLMCMQEMAVVGSLPKCIRVLIFWNTEKNLKEIIHIYLKEAKTLRPDIVKGNEK